ncbi:MAG: hypothetical protein A2096_13010 [Spirochaetes bacterium GWF1_41_5]|nr:MAG: hypothetical protein A2096_13010 [Spirochaetes bacterium GWF1_41_5]
MSVKNPVTIGRHNPVNLLKIKQEIHYHAFTEIVYIYEGRGILQVENKKYSFSRGDMIIVPSFLIHIINHKCNVFNVLTFFIDIYALGSWFEGSLYMDEYIKYIDLLYKIAPVQHNPDKSLPGFIKNNLQIEKEDIASRINAVLNFFTYLKNMKLQNNNNSNSRVDFKFWKVLSYIEQNYAKKIEIKQIAKTFDLTPYYFTRKFKYIFKENFKNFLNRFRIKKAQSLLFLSDKSVSEIAFSVGFIDNNYFSRIFKKFTGIPAKQYRDNLFT